jgi:hypothetical protein
MLSLPMFSKKEDTCERELSDLMKALEQAQKDYCVAASCFDEAVESDRIDEAIFLMEAARRKYSYYLKRLRDYTQEGQSIWQ